MPIRPRAQQHLQAAQHASTIGAPASPHARRPEGAGGCLISAEEDEAAYRDPGHPRDDALVQCQRTLLGRNEPQRAHRALVLWLGPLRGLVQHDPCLRHVEGRGQAPGDRARRRSAHRALDGVRRPPLPVGPRGLHPLVDGKLDERERDLPGDRRPVADVEPADALGLEGVGHHLGEGRVLPHLQPLGANVRRHAHQARGHLAAG
mmetsp:Transcript_91606/g.255815  ORF Transcript_91606/g.255815 Transcript_91606/m.255815 type:complete len:205 (+) Transcript_91606:332-946(+)